MGRSVWKYPLTPESADISGRHHVMMPRGAHVLTVQQQHGVPTLWALVDPGVASTVRVFEWVGTGHVVSDLNSSSYAGTVQARSGDFVFHLFEVKDLP